jgi:hypothetical protein
MVNGVFEGANRSDFSDAKVLHTVTKMDGACFHSTKIRSLEPYRYVRYLSPGNGYGNVAEIVFYNDKGEKLGGTPFGSPCQNSMACDMAFDGDILTFYDAAEASGSHAGLDLGEPQTIAEIRYFPRIEDSFIYEGYAYDLFYWKGMEWQVLEQQMAAGNFLDFRIPANGMYYLNNTVTGKPGKWFTLDENGKQRWL